MFAVAVKVEGMISDVAMSRADYDHDGKLSFTDFEKAVRDENLLLEAFGPCLPDIKPKKIL
ncbi:hypothetical protein DV515_00001517 [Chloebia gouldiae]|uniref:EF-hand domain-containing protein n=1 Tax=Chloebia gouldiae TaxID=44316 RepID=A0A3L8SXY3_CHLGU|nr:hypothetical protein DV515_00001517 [Chloebia gouldiae]